MRLKSLFEKLVAVRYQLYNGLFLTLPFVNLPKVGAQLPIFAEVAHRGLANKQSPKVIVESFFKHLAPASSFEEQMQYLFLMLQFVERQVVLFDALEDNAFSQLHTHITHGTLSSLFDRLVKTQRLEQAWEYLQTYKTRIVLTAHPTQFYPIHVLSVIEDLTHAISQDDITSVHDLLLQLGKTSFKYLQKPTPYDEAKILIHQLQTVFYPVVKQMHYRLSSMFERYLTRKQLFPACFELGFWPGGDRDGNPYVTTEITQIVASRLKEKILECYIEDLGVLRRRLTFPNILEHLQAMREKLQATKLSITQPKIHSDIYHNADELLRDALMIKHLLVVKHESLFLSLLDQFISAVICFGFHFASLDLRQDSRIHQRVVSDCMQNLYSKKINYLVMTDREKFDLLIAQLQQKPPMLSVDYINDDKIRSDVIHSLMLVAKIQQENGHLGMHRYVISNTQSSTNVLEILWCAHIAGLSIKKPILDIVPLFETIPDLQKSCDIMAELFSNSFYKNYLKNRGHLQYVMLGFSDGTKDGGYVTANWEIFQCKRALSELAKKHGITIVFFDGRGGPPARGGGNTHQFYRALENDFCQHQIQLTVQGQTISSKFGTVASAQFNIEQLFTSALEPKCFPEDIMATSETHMALLNRLSEISYQSYQQLKDSTNFVEYLEQITPLQYYGKLNIASRPPRRARKGPMQFSDLRAIPFVGSWAQMKQNVPGYYGFGYALNTMINTQGLEVFQTLYQSSLFFKTLVHNAMMSLSKSYFPLTQYLHRDKKFGKFWKKLKLEADLTSACLLEVSKQPALLSNDIVNCQSIAFREELVFPLLIIQQYALMVCREAKIYPEKYTKKEIKIFQNLVLKSMAANINASRNAA